MLLLSPWIIFGRSYFSKHLFFLKFKLIGLNFFIKLYFLLAVWLCLLFPSILLFIFAFCFDFSELKEIQVHVIMHFRETVLALLISFPHNFINAKQWIYIPSLRKCCLHENKCLSITKIWTRLSEWADLIWTYFNRKSRSQSLTLLWRSFNP